jgi:uncharacterized membrane protein YbhN (UPF0104 family)
MLVVGSILYQLAFFGGLAAVTAASAAAIGVDPNHLIPVAGLFILSWLIGFAVPLAPGGLGVREASGVVLLSGSISAESALVLLATMRIVSLLGDLAMFMVGLWAQRRLHLLT